MRKKIQLTPSGISFVDEAWGGFYNCGTYLLVGPHKSGRTLLSLQFIQEAIKQNSVCIYFTNMRPRDLMINAASINFDLQNYMDNNRVILIRINLPKEKDLENNPDKYYSEYLKEIASVVEQYQPQKIVFDELTPFVNFNDLNKLKEIYLQTCETIESLNVSSLFVLSEPVSQQSNKILNLLTENSTGMLQLQKKENTEGLIEGGQLTITPNIGHTEGQFSASYYIQPRKGLVTETKKVDEEPNKIVQQRKKETPYKSLSEVETSKDNYQAISFYNENEFRLLINNQLAFYKSTGKGFVLCSILLNENTRERGLLTLNQLKNTVRLSVDRKDKIAIIDNRIIVLIIEEDQKTVNRLFARIKSNLPAENNEELTKVIQCVSVFSVQVDETYRTADDLLKKIFSDKIKEKYF